MGCDSQFHGENDATDWADDMNRDAGQKTAPEPLILPTEEAIELNPQQSVRTLAAQLAANILSSTSKPNMLAGKVGVSAEEIIELATFILGDEEEPFRGLMPWQGPFSYDLPSFQEDRLLQKVRDRQATFDESLGELFGRLIGKDAFTGPADPFQPNMTIPVAEVRDGDVVAGDGDKAVGPAVADGEHWIVTVQCPHKESGDTFDMTFNQDDTMRIFRPGAEGESVLATNLRAGDLIKGDPAFEDEPQVRVSLVDYDGEQVRLGLENLEGQRLADRIASDTSTFVRISQA